MCNLNNRVQNNRISWVHHVERMEPERIPEQSINDTPRGARSTGHPNLRWKERNVSKGPNVDVVADYDDDDE
jgi:hypothetical protein